MNRGALRRQVLDSLLLPQEFGFPGLRYRSSNYWMVLAPSIELSNGYELDNGYRSWYSHAALAPLNNVYDYTFYDRSRIFESQALMGAAASLKVGGGEILQFVNEAISTFLKRLDPEALRVARLFQPRFRLDVLRKIYEKGKRCGQLFEVFPALASAIYFNNEPFADFQELHAFVEEGLRASDIAYVIDMPKSFKKVPHTVAFEVGGDVNTFKDLIGFMPTNPFEAILFVRGVNLLEGTRCSLARRWFASHWNSIELREWLRENVLGVWVEGFRDFVRAEELYGVRPFDPNMAVATVIRLVREWHDRVEGAQRCEKEENFDEVLRLPRVPTSTVEGFTLKPLTTRRELDSEGRAMHNCVYSYAERVRDGECDIVSVSKGADRVATMEVVLDEGGLLEIAQLRGKRNAEVPGDVQHACEAWLLNLNKEGRE